MSNQGGQNSSSNMNSSGISGWFFGNQDKNTGGGYPKGNTGSGGGNGGSSSYGNSNNGFMSISKNTQDWQSGRNVNIWMPQSL